MKKSILIAVIVLATIITFLPTLHNGFTNWDDDVYVTKNSHVAGGLNRSNIVWAFTAMHAANWHPLTWLSHQLDCTLFGLHPAGHHLTNLLFHLANVVVLFLVLNAMTGAMWQSGFVAALFALHPMHVESVVWIAERKDVLSTLFLFLTIGGYLRYIQRRTIPRYVLVVAVFMLGLMAKPMLVTVPFLLLLLDYWPLRRMRLSITDEKDTRPGIHGYTTTGSKRQRKHGAQTAGMKEKVDDSRVRTTFMGLVVEKLPLFLISIVSCIVTYIAQKKGGSVVAFVEVSTLQRITKSIEAYGAYLEKLVLPINLSCFYPYKTAIDWQATTLSAVFIVVVTALCMALFRKRPFLFVGWLWFLGTLVPVIGWVKIGSQAIADRYTYVPYVGLFIMAAWGIPVLVSKVRNRTQILATGAIIVISTTIFLSWQRCPVWRDSETIWTDVIRKSPKAGIAYYNLGVHYIEKKQYTDAARALEHAIQFDYRIIDAYSDLAYALIACGEPAKAVTYCDEALRKDKNAVSVHRNRGAALAKLGNYDETISALEIAVRLEPQEAETRFYLGAYLLARNRFDESIFQLTQALRLQYRSADIYQKLGEAFSAIGKYAEALNNYAQALRINPRNATLHNDIGVILAQQGKFAEALPYFQEALRLKPDFAKAQRNLAQALALHSSSAPQ